MPPRRLSSEETLAARGGIRAQCGRNWPSWRDAAAALNPGSMLELCAVHGMAKNIINGM